MWRKILNLVADKVVVVSKDIKQKLSIDESKIEVQPAFIPPQSHSSEMPLDILDFISKARDAHKKIIVSNAFRLAQHNGQDLYGLDLCVEAFSNIEINSQAVLVFIISDPEYNHAQIEKIMVSVKSQRLESCVLIYRGAIDFFNLLQHADVSVRATNTDGDALSVRESIYLGVPCISSNCVKRPKEAILFNNRSVKSLTDKIVKTITIKENSNTFDATNYFDIYRKIYLGK
ncbi:hypothetical protein CFI10_15775 [Marinobacterium iners]|nr:hypothetical protein CFI10_15775 [Marinobacterium iners]